MKEQDRKNLRDMKAEKKLHTFSLHSLKRTVHKGVVHSVADSETLLVGGLLQDQRAVQPACSLMR